MWSKISYRLYTSDGNNKLYNIHSPEKCRQSRKIRCHLTVKVERGWILGCGSNQTVFATHAGNPSGLFQSSRVPCDNIDQGVLDNLLWSTKWRPRVGSCQFRVLNLCLSRQVRVRRSWKTVQHRDRKNKYAQGFPVAIKFAFETWCLKKQTKALWWIDSGLWWRGAVKVRQWQDGVHPIQAVGNAEVTKPFRKHKHQV